MNEITLFGLVTGGIILAVLIFVLIIERKMKNE